MFQGFLMITAPRCTTVETAVRLWAHECSRVFYDRLINREDQQWFENLVVELLPRYLKVCRRGAGGDGGWKLGDRGLQWGVLLPCMAVVV